MIVVSFALLQFRWGIVIIKRMYFSWRNMMKQGYEYGKLVSVVVPVYNVKDYLAECLDSLLAQTYPYIEILLIDDGSTDGSADICDEYSLNNSQIKVFHKENGGVSSARNLGIDKAEGEYLIFVDADDKIHKKMIDIYMKAASKNKIVVCKVTEGFGLFDSEIIEDDSEFENFRLEDFMKFFSGDYVNSPCNKLYRRDILGKYQMYFQEDLSFGEGLLFNLAYFTYSPKIYKVFSHPLYYYRVDRTDSLSSVFRMDLFELQLLMFQKLEQFLIQMDLFVGENKGLYYTIFWNRLYLTFQIYENYIKKTSDKNVEEKLKEILEHRIWEDVWNSCRIEKLITKKMKLKKFRVELYKKIGR